MEPYRPKSSESSQKKQKNNSPSRTQRFIENEEGDSFFDDEIPDPSQIFTDAALARFKKNDSRPNARSPLAIAENMKHNPDGWPYDSDEAQEIIKALESEEPVTKGS